MRSAKEWVDELSQSGPFDLVRDTEDAERIVQAIQEDSVGELWCDPPKLKIDRKNSVCAPVRWEYSFRTNLTLSDLDCLGILGWEVFHMKENQGGSLWWLKRRV